MKHMEPISDLDPERPACLSAQAALQRLLDGEDAWDSPDAAAHRDGCVACREELALARSLSRLSAPVVVPAEMSTRILNASVTAHRRRRIVRLTAAGLALAASVAIAVVVLRTPQPITPEPAPLVVVPVPKDDVALATPQKPLGESVSDARDAIVTLTKRTATEPRDRFTRLLPEPKLGERPDAGEGLEPLADARTGAARSVEPIRDSAMRAVNFFLKAADPPSRKKDVQ
jgi:hypothetical protein